jgi:hypothetical protein
MHIQNHYRNFLLMTSAMAAIRLYYYARDRSFRQPFFEILARLPIICDFRSYSVNSLQTTTTKYF